MCMSCKAGNKNHKERCKRYKQEGRRLLNKDKKKKRHEKRLEKFKKRKEEGKSYVYSPNPYEIDTMEYVREENLRQQKNKPHKTDVAIWDGIMRKVQNITDKEKALAKEAREKMKNG